MTDHNGRQSPPELTRRAHDALLEDSAEPASVAARVRDLVAQSWRRSKDAGIDPDTVSAPVDGDEQQLREYRDAHPLSRVFPLLYDVLGRAAQDCDAVMAIGDADGRLLWVSGQSSVLRRAEQIHFVEGATWSEAAAGTNAPGTALHLGEAVGIRADEHFALPVQRWSCAAAPVHDPVTRAVIGVVDVTGGDDVASVQTVGLVRAAARMAEAELGRLAALEGPIVGSRGLGQPETARLEGLGRPDCEFTGNRTTQRLSPRHSEIVVLLGEHPEGVTGDQLAVELYFDDVRTSTVRAELARLRTLLGPQILHSRPYRLSSTVRCDWREVLNLLDAGRTADAVRAYKGPLLPMSEAPGVVELRERLERRLRECVLISADHNLMTTWTRSRWGADDLDVWTQQARLLPPSSPLRAAAVAEVQRLDRALRA